MATWRRMSGLRKFMLGVYNKLSDARHPAAAGVLAYVAGTVEPVTQLVFGTPLSRWSSSGVPSFS